MTAPAKGAEEKALPQAFLMEDFLDRLMAAESGGRLDAKNPRSTALGPFQFIESTFLFVVNKYFPSEVASLTREQVLALRTDMAFSRRAAGAYSNHLISALKNEGLPATTVNVRLAFLVGPDAAVRLLQAPPDQPLTTALSAEAIAANPYMSGATIAKSRPEGRRRYEHDSHHQAAGCLEGRAGRRRSCLAARADSGHTGQAALPDQM